jgi:hypothetical protein
MITQGKLDRIKAKLESVMTTARSCDANPAQAHKGLRQGIVRDLNEMIGDLRYSTEPELVELVSAMRFMRNVTLAKLGLTCEDVAETVTVVVSDITTQQALPANCSEK